MISYQSVPGNDWLPELASIYPPEEEVLLWVIWVHHSNTANLGQRLHYQHTRHDGSGRKVTRKEVVIDRNVLQANCLFALFIVDNPVH